jgi:hypothetical protein
MQGAKRESVVAHALANDGAAVYHPLHHGEAS